MVKLVEPPKHHKVVGCKIFKKAYDVLRIEEVKVESCGTTKCNCVQGQTSRRMMVKLEQTLI